VSGPPMVWAPNDCKFRIATLMLDFLDRKLLRQ
jgi:hypothetical protein